MSDCIQRKNELEKTLENSRQNLKNLLKAYTDNVVERSIYEEMQNDYLREKNECQKHITAIESQIELIKQSVLNQKDKESILKKYTHIDTLTIPIVQEFIDSIIISEVSSQNGQRDIIINMAV